MIRPFEQESINIRLPESIYNVQGVFPPLGLAYIAGVLEKRGVDVEILDIPALHLTKGEVEQFLFEKKPYIVGISCMSSTIHGALEVAQLAKKAGAKVVLGGPQIAAFPAETLTHDCIDYGVLGEGEYVFPDLIQALQSKASLLDIKGLVFKQKNKVRINSYRLVDKLDTLPFPARHLLPMQNYDCVISQKPFTTMVTSRGCPYHCSFCFKQPSDRKYRLRSVANVVSEMQHCIAKWSLKEIMFYDDSFTSNKKFVSDLCTEIIRRKIIISWEAPTRGNAVNDSLLSMMKKAGCIRLRYGVESGNQRILNLMNKGITLKQVEHAFRLTRQHKIETFAYFMIGYPGETVETIQETIKFAIKINPDWVMFTAVTPLPCTDLFDAAIEKRIVPRDYWKEYALGKKMSRIPYFINDAEQWVRTAYRTFYFRPRFILRKFFSIRDFGTIKKYFKGAKGIVLFKMHK